MVSNVTVRGIVVILVTGGVLAYLMLYRAVPADIMAPWALLLGYYFGHSGAESTAITTRANGNAVTPDVLSRQSINHPAATEGASGGH